MYLAALMMLAFVVLAACVRERASDDRTVFGTIALSLAVASFAVIAMDYFIQLRTVQPALLLGEAEGLAIISQYNPHGVFIALEELGFLVMGLSFGFLAFSLGASRLERVTRWVLSGLSGADGRSVHRDVVVLRLRSRVSVRGHGHHHRVAHFDDFGIAARARVSPIGAGASACVRE